MVWSTRLSPALLLLAACVPATGGGSTGETGGSTGQTSLASETSGDADPTTTPEVPTTSTAGTTMVDMDTSSSSEQTSTPEVPVCGDGVLGSGEACDDGNMVDGDCCSADCGVGPSEPGQECWTVRVEGTKNGADRGAGVAVDGADNVYILTSVVDSFAQSDILIRKYDPGPFSQWTQQYDGGVNGADIGSALAGDAAGFMVALGRQTVTQGEPGVGWISKCTPNGQVVWAFTDPTFAGGDVALAGDNGDFVVVGVIKQGGNNNALVRKYADGGVELWTEFHAGAANNTDFASGVAVDGAGNILVVGREFVDLEGFNIWVQQYAADGTPGWSETLDGGFAGIDWANAVAFDDAGEAVVVGRIETGSGHSDAWLRKYTTDGAEVWTQTYAGELGQSDEAVAVAIAATGEIAVAGTTEVAGQERDIFVNKRSPGGDELWTRTHGTIHDDGAGDVAFTADGSVIVIGTEVLVPSTNSDVWLRKYSP